MIDLYLSLEQDKKEQQDLEAINELADRNTDLESSGHWDGWLNEPAKEEHWGELAYRKGYVTGITQYYDQKYHISIEEF